MYDITRKRICTLWKKEEKENRYGRLAKTWTKVQYCAVLWFTL